MPDVINIFDSNKNDKDTPIAARTHNRTKQPTPPPPPSTTHGSAYNTRSWSTRLLNLAISVAQAINPSATLSIRLTKRTPPLISLTQDSPQYLCKKKTSMQWISNQARSSIIGNYLNIQNSQRIGENHQANNFDRLVGGSNGIVKCTDTIFLIHPHEVPSNIERMQHTEASNAIYTPKIRNLIELASPSAGKESTTLEK